MMYYIYAVNLTKYTSVEVRNMSFRNWCFG